MWSHETDRRRIALYERRGYSHVSTFLRLDRDLDDTLEPPVWPAGIRVAAFRPGVDDAAVYAAHEEAFADHPGAGEIDLEEWLASHFAHEGPDLGLWLVAWDGAEVVGGIEATETPAGAYMGELFVREPWRGRGIARALMLQECAELRRRGVRTRSSPWTRTTRPGRCSCTSRSASSPGAAHAALREAARRRVTGLAGNGARADGSAETTIGRGRTAQEAHDVSRSRRRSRGTATSSPSWRSP